MITQSDSQAWKLLLDNNGLSAITPVLTGVIPDHFQVRARPRVNVQTGSPLVSILGSLARNKLIEIKDCGLATLFTRDQCLA